MFDSVCQVYVGTEPTMGNLNLTGRSPVVVPMDVTQTQGNVSMVDPVNKDNLPDINGQDRPVELVMVILRHYDYGTIIRS